MDFETFATAELAITAKKLADAMAARVATEVADAVAAARTQSEEAMARATRDAQSILSEARADAEATVARIRAEADDAIASARANDGGLVEQARSEAGRLQSDAVEELARVRAQAQADMSELRAATEAEIAALRGAADMAATTTASFGAMIEKLRDDRTQLAGENERLAAENAALTYERSDIVERAQASSRGPFISRLSTVVGQVAIASTVEEVLTAAAGGLVGEFSRVAVLSVRDSALVPIFHRGFDPNSGLDKVVVALGVDSFLTNTTQWANVQVLRPDEGGVVPFGGNPTLCVAAAIAVRGQSLAVIYADDAGRPVEAGADVERIDLTSVLQAHAMLCLERLTIDLKAMAELRAYAQMLLDEVEYVYEADGESRKPDAERIDRLAENLRCARQIYGQRVTPEGPAAAVLLEEVIARTIERKDSQSFGRDLRAAHDRQPGAHAYHTTAQAS